MKVATGAAFVVLLFTLYVAALGVILMGCGPEGEFGSPLPFVTSTTSTSVTSTTLETL
jgi:hypothetical protein